MAGPFDFTGQNIEDSYQRVLQTDGTLIYDGTGSLFTISGNINTGSFVTTGSFNAYTGSNTSQFAGTASYAQTASYVQNAVSSSFALTASYVQNAQTASFVQNAQTASFVLNAVSSSFASTASYAANGGVTKIIAGGGITISPSLGLGDVTINSTAATYNTATGSYGSFYNTGSVLASSATAVYSMSLSTTDISNGVFVSASNGDVTRVKFTNAGVYDIQFSAQFSNTDNTTQDAIIWIRKNGTDISDSAGTVGIPPFKAGSNGQSLASWNYFLNVSANDYMQLCWHVEQANVITLETIPAGVSPTHPRTPSLILTANRVDTFLSNTGSFSGSFTGNLIGSLLGTATTASYVLNAVSSSFATTAAAATILQTARTIGGVSFNGSANINLPGVNTTGNQNTSGNAATATMATNVIVDFSSSAATLQAAFPTVRFFPIFGAVKTGLSVDYYYVNSGSFQYILGTNTLTVTSSYANQALSSSRAVSSSFATTASYFSGSISNAINATSASFASTASFTPNAIVTASVSSNTITFTKGNGTTFPITVNTGSGGGGGGGAAFPYTGSATILGSLVVNENAFGGPITSLDTSNRTLQDNSGQSSINWASRVLYNPSGSTTALNWQESNFLNSNVYQRDIKSVGTQNNVSATVGNQRSYLGDVIEVASMHGSVSNGMLVFLHPGGIWYPVNQADPRATCLLGIAYGVNGSTGYVLLEGHVAIDDTSTAVPYVAGAGYGLPVYIEDSTTTGTMSTTVPTTTGGPNIVRVLGHCYQRNVSAGTQWMMKFRPSNDWVEI